MSNDNKSIVKKWWFWLIIFAILSCVLVFGLGFASILNEGTTTTIPVSATETSGINDLDESTTVEPSMAYKIVEADTDDLGRREIRVTISPEDEEQSTDGDITQFLKELTQKQIAAHHPKGLIIFLYAEGDDTEDVYTIARCRYAPNGNWEDIVKYGSNEDYSSYDYSIDINTPDMRKAYRQ
jgi:hypothetical protein